MKFSELSIDEHRAQASRWRGRIKVTAVLIYLAIIFIMINHIVTKDDHWTTWAAAIFWVGMALIGLMFIPLIRHNRKDDKFT